jgi:hypothetical protein
MEAEAIKPRKNVRIFFDVREAMILSKRENYIEN